MVRCGVIVVTLSARMCVMDENDWLAERFEEQRTHLRAVAYRMLGSLSEADDAVQDAWVRVSRAEVSEVENLGGWLTTIVARVCLNMLRSRNVRREESLEVHLPDPVISPEGELRPEDEVLLADSVGLALQVVLDALAPAERLAFVLHDMFELPFEEIAPMVGRSPAAARQLASRARRRVKGADVPDPTPTSLVNAPWSTPSSWQPAAATSTHWSPCSTPTSCLRADFGPSRPSCVHGRPRRSRCRQTSAPGRQSGGTAPPRVGERGGGRRHHAGWASLTS